MKKLYILKILIVVTAVQFIATEPGSSQDSSIPRSGTSVQDTMILNQLFYNGRIWAGRYYEVYGSEFFISEEWLDADITTGQTVHYGVKVKYDIYNDDLLASYLGKRVLILNPMNVNSFTLFAPSGEMEFTRIDSVAGLTGYCRVLYKGTTSLCLKQRKKRAQFAIEARYDEFQQDDVLYLVRQGRAYQVSNRKSLMKILNDRQDEVKLFLREQNLKIDIKRPEQLVPLLKFYDTL